MNKINLSSKQKNNLYSTLMIVTAIMLFFVIMLFSSCTHKIADNLAINPINDSIKLRYDIFYIVNKKTLDTITINIEGLDNIEFTFPKKQYKIFTTSNIIR